MVAVIKRVRRKPDEEYKCSFFAEYPVFTPDENGGRTAESAEATAVSDEKPGSKRKKKRQPAAASHERLNTVIGRFIGAAESSAGRSGAESVSVTQHIYNCDDNFISFTLDVQRRTGASLLYLRRFCFNWDCAAGVMLPLSEVTRYHRRLERENGGSRDYTVSPGTLFMQRSAFTREAGQNCRRSQYRKFLTASPYDLRALRGGEKQPGGVTAG